jgi:biopolymer transport protein ExbD
MSKYGAAAAAHRALVLEIDGKLLHAEVIKLVDTAVATGFPAVEFALLDPKAK